MSTLPKGFSNNIRADGDSSYYFEEEILGENKGLGNVSLYDDVLKLEQSRVYDFEGHDIDMQLELIKDEIRCRIKVTQNEIFVIGELLHLAKKKCKEKGTSFQKWITDNFDFSYETANNMMNVFTYCFGIRRIAQNIPLTILYKISKPNFPEELRDYLFAKGNLNKITNGKLALLVEKFRKHGVDAIEADIDGIGKAHQIYKQARFTLDICEDALRRFDACLEKLKQRELLQYSDVPDASKINIILKDALGRSNKLLSKAMEEAVDILNAYPKRIEDSYMKEQKQLAS